MPRAIEAVEIPKVDLGDLKNMDDFRQATQEQRGRLGRAAVEAFHKVGFIYVRHPRDYIDKLDAMYDEYENLFLLDQATLMHYSAEKFNFERGYTPLFTEEALFCKSVQVEGEEDPRKVFNYAENWFVGPEGFEDKEFAPEYSSYVIPNVWPPEMPNLRDVTLPVYDDTREMSDLTMATTEPLLNLPDGYFKSITDDGPTLMRPLNYPPAPKHLIESGEIIGACQHTDINLWTSLPKARNLLKNAGGGLQVRTKWGDWLPGAAPEGYFIMQVGDMLMHETGNYFISAQHRVISPRMPELSDMTPQQLARIKLGRLSCAMFTHPRPDHILQVRDLGIEGFTPKHYADVSAHDKLDKRLKKIFGKD